MLKKIEDNVFYMPHTDSEGCPALGLVSGSKFSLIVDAGNSSEHAQNFRNEINKLRVPPVKYVVLTHHHSAHTSGLKQWADLTSIASKKTNQILKCVDISYEDKLSIDLGGITCIIKEIPSSHAVDSSIVYIPERKVMFIGDLMYTTSPDVKCRYKKAETVQMVESIEKYDADYYVFSHYPLCECTGNGMKEFLGELKILAQNTCDTFAINDMKGKYENCTNSDETYLINAT